MKKTALKRLPEFATDAEAEQFVDTADLSQYDLSGFIPFNLAMQTPRDETYVLVPQDLAEALRGRAEKRGVPFASVVREALEKAIAN